MKALLQKIITPVWALRISLGVMYIYSGYDIFMHPKSWYWAIRPLPALIENPINAFGIDLFLQIQGIVEIVFGLIFLLWFMPRIAVKIAALFNSIEMLLILFLVGVDAVTFRDIGLVGNGIALYLLLREEK